MRRPSRRISRLLGFTVVPVSLIATGLFVTASSYSVFNAQTSNAANSWTAGTITLTDDDGGSTAMFNVSNLKPGSTGSRCIVVNYTGSNTSLAPTIRLYGQNYVTTSTPNLGTQLNIQIEQGSGTSTFANSSGGCTGFTPSGTVYTGMLSAFSTAASSYTTSGTSALPAWSPSAASESRVFKFTWTFQSTGSITNDNTFQGKGTGIDFVWEAQTS